MKRLSFFLLLLGFSFGLISCNASDDGQQDGESAHSFKAEVVEINLVDDVWDGHAISYSGYRTGQRPGGVYPTDAEILEDLRILERNWSLIRVYNSDEHGEAVLRVISATNLDLKVLLGIYIFQTKDLVENALATNEALNQGFINEGLRLAAAYTDIIAGISVGSETLVSWSFVPNEVETITRYVGQVSAGLASAGLNLPVTVAENYEFWQTEAALPLASELDFIVVHLDAMWEGKGIADALKYVNETVAKVKFNLPDKPLVIAGIGWATYAEDEQIYGKIGDGANEANQKIYFDQLSQWAIAKGMTVFFFEAFDELWKGDGSAGTAEVHWGLFNVHRKAKLAIREYYPELVSDVPTSPSYAGFVFNPVTEIGWAFRESAASELSIEATAKAVNPCSVIENTTAFEGSKSLLFYHDGTAPGGFFGLFDPPLDLGDSQHLVVALSGLPDSAKYFELKVEGGGGATSVNILSYLPDQDGIWDVFTIPLSDFDLVDFSKTDALGFWHPFSNAILDESQGHYVAAQILIDDIHFE